MTWAAPEIVYAPGSSQNPFSVPVTIQTKGPETTVHCQLCKKMFKGPLHEARSRLLDHYEEDHKNNMPRLHSFYRGEDIGLAEHAAWQLRQRGA